MRILLAGGGTAGHTSPLLATADALRRLEPAAEITCLGTPRGLETRVVPEAGYPLELIAPVPLPRKPSVDLLRVPGRLRGAVKEARAVLERVRPDVVVGYGGYVSVPAYLAARRAKVPIVVHEQNSLPGLANKVGARFAQRVAVSFPDTPLRHAEYVGLPIRTMISGLDRLALRAEARAFFGLDADLPTLVVTGGSQGARNINDAVSGAARALGEAGVQVLHVVGPKNDVVPQDGVPDLRADRLRRPDGLRPRRRRPHGLPGRRLQRHRGRRRRRTGDLRAAAVRQRRAAAERQAGRRGRGSAAGGRRGVHERLGDRARPGAGRRTPTGWPR